MVNMETELEKKLLLKVMEKDKLTCTRVMLYDYNGRINTVSCPIKFNSNTIELTVQISCIRLRLTLC